MTSQVSPVRVLVVDDHEVVRVGLTSLLSRDERFVVVGAASSGAEALRLFDKFEPDVAILDQRLPDMPGAVLCSEMVNRRPRVSIIMLTGVDNDDVIHACLVAGARGFLTKDVANVDLAGAVRAVADGQMVLAPLVTERLVAWARQAKNLGSTVLVAEEIQVLSLVAQGKSNRQIAAELCVGESTAKLRLQTAMKKLGVSTRLEAVAVGRRRAVI